MTKTQKIIVAGVVLVLAGGWFFWFRHYQDRRKFERIEASVETLTQRLEREFGASQISSEKYCSQGDRKFEQNVTLCGIVSEIDIKNNKIDSVIDFLTEQHDIIESGFQASGNYYFFTKSDTSDCVYKLAENDVTTLRCVNHATKPHFTLLGR